jgi:hypothetical protein
MRSVVPKQESEAGFVHAALGKRLARCPSPVSVSMPHIDLTSSNGGVKIEYLVMMGDTRIL